MDFLSPWPAAVTQTRLCILTPGTGARHACRLRTRAPTQPDGPRLCLQGEAGPSARPLLRTTGSTAAWLRTDTDLRLTLWLYEVLEVCWCTKKKPSNFNVTINRQRFGICWFWKSSNYQPCLWFIYGLIMTLLFLSATAITPSDSSESRLLPIGLGIGFLLVVVVVAVCFITRWVRHLILSLSAHVQYFSLVISLFLQEEEDIKTKLVCPRWDKRSGTLRGCSEKWGLQKQPPEKQTIYFVAFFPKIILCVTALKNLFFFSPETAIKQKG